MHWTISIRSHTNRENIEETLFCVQYLRLESLVLKAEVDAGIDRI